MAHQARQYSDQTHCHVCGKQWDVNDPEPPPCTKKPEQKEAPASKWIEKLKRKVSRHR